MRYFLPLLFALLLGGCGRELTDPDLPIDTAVGQEFELVLSADEETGYHWELLERLDQTILRFVEKSYDGGGLSISNPGSSSCEIWRFRAVGAGEATIQIGYMVPPGVEFSTQDSVQVFTVRAFR